MPFEKFVEGGKAFKPKISIRKNGQIGFNQAAVNKFKLGNYKYAVLYYDSERQMVGIKFTDDKNEEGAHKMQIRAGSGAVSGKSFLDFCGITYSKTMRYDLKRDEQEEMLVAIIRVDIEVKL